MIVNNINYTMIIDDTNGSLLSLKKGSKQFIAAGAYDRPLFTLRFRDEMGKIIDLTAKDALRCDTGLKKKAECDLVEICYDFAGFLPVTAFVTVTCPHNEPFTYWNLSVEHDTDYYIEWIDFPDVVVPNDLVGAKGDSRIFWPAMEGCVVEDVQLRENHWLKYSPVGYPSKGWEGYYPGPCPMQFMAYYDNNNGLYFAAHDEECNVKAVEYYQHSEGVRLEFRLFPGAIGKGTYRMSYDMIIGVFSGDWHDAAEIYREWYKNSKIPKPQKIYNSEKLPAWFEQSPVTLIYPVRGQMHMGDMSPNEDFYPFTNALPHIERLAKDFDSMVMALPMQWEGTAPWAPPYVWPPFGGEENYLQFVNGLHEKGNLAAVYCSGIAWTNESVLVPEYNRKDQFEQQGLIDIMCASPEGDVPNSLICNGPIRLGYDMCPANQFVKDVVLEEVAKIVNSGCDYIQFFDQNLGGASYFCYSRKHGHPPAPGKWQKDEMINLFSKVNEMIEASGKNVLIGCEAAAAEPYISYLLFNDLRFEINYYFAKPVPAYAYVYHEYINNFMGNQNGVSDSIDMAKSPDNLLLRTAYSFIAGDMLTVVLKGRGEIHSDWCAAWDAWETDQDSIKTLVKNLNAWRKGMGKPFLCFGQMQKPLEIQGTYDVEIVLKSGGKHKYPSLLTSRWSSPDGRQAQIIVNYTRQEQRFSIKIEKQYNNGINMKVHSYPEGNSNDHTVIKDPDEKILIQPFCAVLVEFI